MPIFMTDTPLPPGEGVGVRGELSPRSSSEPRLESCERLHEIVDPRGPAGEEALAELDADQGAVGPGARLDPVEKIALRQDRLGILRVGLVELALEGAH